MLAAGYHIRIRSWENDADNYNTITIVTQNEDEVKFYAEWLPLFKTASNGGIDNDHFGNMGDWEWTEEIAAHIRDLTNVLCRKYGLEEIEETEDGLYHVGELVYDALGSSEGRAYRVFESMEVYYFEKDIPEYKVKI